MPGTISPPQLATGMPAALAAARPEPIELAGEGENHNRVDFLHRKRAHARVCLVGAGLRVDHFNVPAGGLRGVGRAGDHGDIQSIVGDKGDNAEGLRFEAHDRGDQRRRSRDE
jgi:hypothetical protein